MNSLKNLETLLRGFHPRPPSPKVRQALFELPAPRVATGVPSGATATPLHLWFAPLAATAVCTLSIATLLLPGTGPASRALAAATPAAAWSTPVGQVERNALPRPSFRSTTGAAVASSFGSLLLRQTNAPTR